MLTKLISLFVLVAVVAGYHVQVKDKSRQEACLITCAGSSATSKTQLIIIELGTVPESWKK